MGTLSIVLLLTLAGIVGSFLMDGMILPLCRNPLQLRQSMSHHVMIDHFRGKASPLVEIRMTMKIVQAAKAMIQLVLRYQVRKNCHDERGWDRAFRMCKISS